MLLTNRIAYSFFARIATPPARRLLMQMSTLEQSMAEGEVKGVSAVAFLLSLVFPRVPASVLRKHFSKPATVLMKTLSIYNDEDSPQALVKAV